ncbi:MAG: hypothetical protein V7609_1566 [Verrucomicrobiota bacterium]
MAAALTSYPGINVRAELPPSSSSEASDNSFRVIIKDERGKERHRASHGSRVDAALLAPNQLVEITLKFANGQRGEPVTIGCLDGGEVTSTDAVPSLAADGTVRFTYRAGTAFGAYRLLMRRGPEEYAMTLYVVDAEHPARRVPTPH